MSITTAATIQHPAIVSVTVGEYTIQRFTLWPTTQVLGQGQTGWVPCYINGRDLAIFEDITQAEEQLNLFRDRNKGSDFRMIKTTKIVEVVYA